MGDPVIKRGIIAGVITSLITLIFLQPLLNLLWAATSAVASRFSKSLVDSVYQRTAEGQTHWIDLQFLTWFIAAWWGFTAGIIAASVTDKSGRRASSGDFTVWMRRNSGLVIAVLILGAFDGGVSLAKNYFQVQANASFQQRLMALAPYVTDRQEKELLSMWALMRTSEDCDRINAVLEEYARRHNIDLPKPRPR